jgi:hypothetical protein
MLMNQKSIKNLYPHILVVVIFMVLSYIYFSPLLENKEIQQSDKSNYLGAAKEINDFRDKTGEEALWSNSMFGGMPAYLTSTLYPTNLIKYVDKGLHFLKRPASQLFILLFGGYVLFLIFGANPYLSFIGAIAFAFTSYNFVIIAAGHNSKVYAIAYMAPLIGGIYLAYKKNVLLGSAIMAMALSLQLVYNHLQITYYTLIIVIVFGIVELFYSIKEKSYNKFIKTSAILLVAAFIAVGTNFSLIWTTYEYGKFSIRGKSELTHNQENKTSGLDKDYATQWSYGIDETMTLLIPNFKGGASGGEVGKNSASYEFFKSVQGERYASQVIKQLPLYWGTQPFTSGPVYVGAIIVFLFVMGLFVLDRKLKWWLVSATVLSIILAWGHNFSLVTNFFLDHVPGYNKFRTVSMTLVIAQFAIPLMAILTLKKIIDGSLQKQEIINALKKSLYIIGGICLFFALLPGIFFDFKALSDQTYIQQGAQAFVDALSDDRKMLLRTDAIRSLIFILLSAGILFAYLKNKVKINVALISLAILVLFDLWMVDKRYMNNDSFVSKQEAREPFRMTTADKMILQDKDPNFRVLNVSVNTFNDASTAYFHKSIGGYHGAKMRRYQELIDFHIMKNNMDVLNMLNTKYFIVPGENRQPMAQINPGALGNAWFVETYRIVADADAEIEALSDFDPAKEAIIDQRYENYIAGKNFTVNSASEIRLIQYKPNHLLYSVNCATEQLAVFSEIYYPKGWKAFIDGNAVPHFSVNYVLRAMVIPQGQHQVEFKFEPESYFKGNKVSLVSSIILLLAFVVILIKEIKPILKKD